MIKAVAGQTAPIYRYLRIDDAVPTNADGTALTMSGMSVVFEVEDHSGNDQAISGTVSVENSALWLVKYSPATGDMAKGSWRCQFKVTDSGGKSAYFPTEWEELTVRGS